MMLKLRACLFFVVLIVAGCPAPATAQDRGARSVGGIRQLVERRDGRLSCWGVVVELDRLRFKPNILADHLIIREDGHDLRDTMMWRVGQGGRRLVIKFKPGMGDFGSGNAVDAQVAREAFVEPSAFHNSRAEWSISTDLR